MDIRTEFTRLLHSKDLQTMIESHKIITDVGFAILYKQGQKVKFQSYLDNDANILFQMSLTKCLSILELAKPINYSNGIDGNKTHTTYDPFSVYNLVRAQYEAFCNFSNIYLQSPNKNDIELKYYLWVLSGLNYRQRFEATLPETIKKQQEEKKEIDHLVSLVEANSTFLALEEQSKTNLREGIKKRDWQFKIAGTKAHKIAWHEMMTNAGVNDLLEGQYTNLSLATHPSNVSVFQFDQMYINNSQGDFLRMAVQISKIIIAMQIRDYCMYFSECRKMFDNLPTVPQMLINSVNRMFRSDNYVINNHGETE